MSYVLCLMSYERDPTLHGGDIGAGIGIRDIFELHVSMYRSVVECIPIGDKRGSTIDFGDNRPSRKITQHIVFVMISNGKRQGHQSNFPILFFLDESIR